MHDRTTSPLPLKQYGALGDGCSVAVTGSNGSIDWWCVPNLDSPPLFDRLLDQEQGGYFQIEPLDSYEVESRNYLYRSNVLQTVFSTKTGRVQLLEALNSGSAGRLPWAELARRMVGLEGTVTVRLTLRYGRRADTISPYAAQNGKHRVFHAADVLGVLLHTENLEVTHEDDDGFDATVTLHKDERAVFAIVAGKQEPLILPTVGEVDDRIDRTDARWREWAGDLNFNGEHKEALLRNALALKLLINAPTGAIAAAATTSLPEKIGSNKNWDYRYAWVRDAAYVISTLLGGHAIAESQSAFRWLLTHIANEGLKVCYTLSGAAVPAPQNLPMPGYQDSQPVSTGNQAGTQHQHGIYGDIFGTAYRFMQCGGFLDAGSAALLSSLADQCADRWREPDSGMWELTEPRHYTISKIGCWGALAAAVELAEQGYLPTTCEERWRREAARIVDWIDAHCWSDREQAYAFYAGSDELDASIALAMRCGFPRQQRVQSTLNAIDRELACKAFHYRYTGMDKEEGCFLACTFWLAEAFARCGEGKRAERMLHNAIEALAGGVGIYAEMVDPHTGEYLGNLPQGLTHLAVIEAMVAVQKAEGDGKPAR